MIDTSRKITDSLQRHNSYVSEGIRDDDDVEGHHADASARLVVERTRLNNQNNNNDSSEDDDDEEDSSIASTFWERLQRRQRPTERMMANANNSSTAATIPPAARNHWIALLFGQLIALLAACMNATSYTLVHKYAVNTPLFQLFFMYTLLLSLHLLPFVTITDTSTAGHRAGGEEASPQDDEDDSGDSDSDENSESDATDSSTKTTTNNNYYYPFPSFLPSRIIRRRIRRRRRLRVPWWIYLGMSVLDVGPNFLTLLSLRYTSLTSTTLLGSSLTVPSTMFFSRHIFSSRVFQPHHYVGMLLCVLGGTLTFYMDAGAFSSTIPQQQQANTTTTTTADGGAIDGDQSFHTFTTTTYNTAASPTPHHSYSFIGDLLALTAALCYGLGDSVAEYFVKYVDRHEYLGMLGFFGVVLTGATFPWIEHEALRDLWATKEESEVMLPVLALFVCYVLSVLLYYEAEAKFLMSSDATLLNLSMQSVNLWAVLFTFTAYSAQQQQQLPPLLFFMALIALVAVGVFIYEMGWDCCCYCFGFCNEKCQRSSSTSTTLRTRPFEEEEAVSVVGVGEQQQSQQQQQHLIHNTTNYQSLIIIAD